MARHKLFLSRIARSNRRGCFIIAAVVALLVAALLYIGLRAGPQSGDNSVIPTLGAVTGRAPAPPAS
jgi:hypothetical protein